MEAKDIFMDITRGFTTEVGKAISKKEREELSLKQTTLTYGEITFDSFGNVFSCLYFDLLLTTQMSAVVFEKIKRKYGKPFVGECGSEGVLQKPGGRFYDLGSGTGKPVVAAAILHNFDQCVGTTLSRHLLLQLTLVLLYRS
jgi:hypothetical protein